MKTHDALVLGTSPNALCAAVVLARGGLSVLVLDTHTAPGGPLATEPFAPGFLADTGVPSAALDAAVAADLRLDLPVLRRATVTTLAPETVTLQDIPLPQAFHQAVDLLRAAYRTPVPSVPVPQDASETASLAALAAHLRGFGPRGVHEVLRLLLLSVRDFLHEAAVPDVHRGPLAAAAMRSRHAGPFDAGTLFGLLHRTAIDDGLFVSTAASGLGAVPRSLAAAATAAGAEMRLGVPGPLRVDVSDGIARGVRLPSGERLPAALVLSDHDARTTFTRLVSPADLPPEFNRTIRQVQYRGTAARVHLALDRLPTFRAVSSAALGGTLVLAPDVASLERAWDQAKRGALPSHPAIELAIPTVLDPSLAPDGKHVLSATVHSVPHTFTDAPAVLRAVLDRLAPFAPDLAASVVASSVALPRDIASRFGLTEGQLDGGESSLAQAFFLRPFPGASRRPSPLENLHLIGSAAHPAGYSGLAGWTFARSILSTTPDLNSRHST